MTTRTTVFDPARYLTDDATIANYLNDCLEEGGTRLFLLAIGDVARARGMSGLATATGVTRAALYKALAESGNPALATMERVLDGLGLQLAVVPKATPQPAKVPRNVRAAPKPARAAAKRHAPATKAARKSARKPATPRKR